MFSDFCYEKNALLSSKLHFTFFLFKHELKILSHAGPQLLLSTKGRGLSRQIVRRCVVCTRVKGKTTKAQMGIIPAGRLESRFPFYRGGVTTQDYCLYLAVED